jgi:S1-C subfamily serine protease
VRSISLTLILVIVLIGLAVGVARPAALVEEGLFLPEQISVPFDKERALKSIVRIRSHIYFAITAVNTTQEAARLQSDASKTYLPEGITVWPLAVEKSFLDYLRINTGLRLRPAYYEMAKAFENVETFPSQKVVSLEGAATGFFISRDGYFLTTYHVVREEIEAAGRTDGGVEPLACRYLSFEVPVVTQGQIVGYRPLNNVQLVRNLSAKARDEGYDVVLLKADIESPAYLELAPGSPTADESVWTIGFPIRTERDAERRRTVGYADADGTLRITKGSVSEFINDHNFVSTADGLSGMSGAPTVNQQGRVVGIVLDVYPKSEENRRAVVFQGGMLHLTIGAAVIRLGLQAFSHQPSVVSQTTNDVDTPVSRF